MANRIKEERRRMGLSQERLAALAGTSRSQIVKLERGERRLTTDWMERLAAVLGCDPADLMARPRNETGARGGAGGAAARQGFADEPIYAAKDLPVLGAARGGEAGLFYDNGNVFEMTYRPSSLQGVRDAYAVYMVGDSMEPRYFAGEILQINPNKPVTRGSFVVVQVVGEEGELNYYVKQFARMDDENAVFTQYNPEREVVFPRLRVRAIHRIVGLAEGG